MPFKLIVNIDYRAVIGLKRRLRSTLKVDIDRNTLSDFISFISSLSFSNIEWYGRIRRIELKELWEAFHRDRGTEPYGITKAPNVERAKEKQIS